MPVPGVLQTVQRAEFWGAILALQAYWTCHLGIDNLKVARTFGRLLDRDSLAEPLPLVKDGDLVALVQYMVRTRGRETVRVTKVQGHAEDVDVHQGRVRLENQVGNAEADTVADLGRRHQSKVLIDARRRLLKARSYWYPIMLDLHRFMIAVAILCKFTAVLGTLHWLVDAVDIENFGVSFLEGLVLFEQWAGHRLLSEKVTRPHVRANRPILIPSVPVSEGIEIRHGCQFLGSLVRALAKLPGGIGRFLPYKISSHMSRLRHLGWNQCSHGLTSRPLESCHHQCLKVVCGGLGYPTGSASKLLDGTLKLRHCTTLFSMRFPAWSSPRVGNGSGTRQVVTPGHLPDAGGNAGKSIRLTRKKRPGVSSHSIPDPGYPTPRRWKRLRPPSSEGEGGEVGVPRNLFPRLGVG